MVTCREFRASAAVQHVRWGPCNSSSMHESDLFLLFVVASDIYFIGGFGTVAWVDVMEYETLQPDKIAVDGGEQNLKVSFWMLYIFLQYSYPCLLSPSYFNQWTVCIFVIL